MQGILQMNISHAWHCQVLRLVLLATRDGYTANDHRGLMQSRTWTVMYMLRPARRVDHRLHLHFVMSSAADRLVYAP